MNSLKQAKWISLLMGILLIINGFIFFTRPLDSLISLVNILSIILIAVGVLRIIRYFTDKIFKTGSFLIGGILDILLGILIIINQPFSIIAFTTFLGFWQIVSGVSEIAISIDLKRFNFPRWWLGLILGILGIIIGFMFINNPASPSIYIGVYLIFYGITFISTFFGISKLIR